MARCRGCGGEFRPRVLDILGEKKDSEYCEPCLKKAKEDYKKLSEELRPKPNPPKKEWL